MFIIGNDISPDVFKNIIGLISKKSITINRYRSKSGLGRSQCFGLVKQRNGKYSGSRLNFERMDIYKELQIIGKKILPGNFEYTSIQVNQNYTTLPHKDTGNRGESAIIGFGDYTNGQLKIEDTPVNIKYKLVYFDGSMHEHSTLPHIGKRYSLVFHRPKPTFKELPIYEIIDGADEKLYLQEDIGGIRRLYDKAGNCTHASNSIYPVRHIRKYSLREAVEIILPILDGPPGESESSE
jgi:hypothetical protein